MIARFRCDNEMKSSQYWNLNEDKKCRVCGEDIEDLTHVLEGV